MTADGSAPPRELRLFVIAGENSGDIHGANLFRALGRLYPHWAAAGLGGTQLKSAGVKLLSNIVDDLAIIGIVGVIQNFPRIWRLLKSTELFLKTKRPDAVILIDYPGFNLRVARMAKKLGIPVIWYISPQIWAWHKSRIHDLRENVTRMLVIFPFEVKLYREVGTDVVHVGHPLFDLIKIDMSREEAFKAFGLDPARPLVGIVPGSRRKEVLPFLPIMLEGARRYAELNPEAQFAIIRASTIEPGIIEELVEKARLPFKPVIVDKFRFNLRNYCDMSWVKSGTSTLEAAILGQPMLIVYKVNFLTWVFAKMIFTIGYIGLPNIVAGDRIVPELLQDEFTPRNLAERTHHFMSHPEEYERMKQDLNRVREKLGGPGASERAARAILEVLGVRDIPAPAGGAAS